MAGGHNLKRKVIVLLIFVCCSMLISCDNQESNINSKENNIKLKKEEEIKEAYEYAKNLEVWDSVLMNIQEYDEAVERKIHENEKLEVYREKDVDPYTNEKIYTYYFKGNEEIKSGLLKNKAVDDCASLKYYIHQETWQTEFASSYKDTFEELIAEGKVEFIGEIQMLYPNAYFPKANLTDYKRKILKEINSYVKDYLKENVKKGEYRITVKDFSDADHGTDVMIQNNEGKISIVPITFMGNPETDFSLGSQTNVSPQFLKDYDLGGIYYSELFSKLSVESYSEEK